MQCNFFVRINAIKDHKSFQCPVELFAIDLLKKNESNCWQIKCKITKQFCIRILVLLTTYPFQALIIFSKLFCSKRKQTFFFLLMHKQKRPFILSNISSLKIANLFFFTLRINSSSKNVYCTMFLLQAWACFYYVCKMRSTPNVSKFAPSYISNTTTEVRTSKRIIKWSDNS